MADAPVPKSKEKTKLAWSTRDALDEAIRREKVAIYGERRGTRLGLIAGGVVLVVGVSLFIAFRAPGDDDPNACLHEHAGFIDVKATCPEPVKLERDGDVIIAHPGASLEERGSGMRVRAGTVGFVAHQRSDGNTLRVLVSHGVIEITGTRFTVTQGEFKGGVKVEEGTVIFRDDDGTDVTLTAGGELAWPRPQPAVVALDAIPLGAAKPAAPTRPAWASASAKASRVRGAVAETALPPAPPPVAAPAPTPAVAVAPAREDEAEDEEVEEWPRPGPMSMEEIIKRISVLRSQKRTSEAVALLIAQSKRGDVTRPQMARLSWEVGLFIQESGDKAAACRHWQSHARKYPDDTGHAEQLRDLIKTCEASL